MIHSVFAIDNEAAIFSLEIEGDVIRPISIWRSSPNDCDLGAAALACSVGDDDSFITAPDPGSEDSFLKLSLTQEGIRGIRVSKEFEPFEARSTLASLLRKGQFDPASYEGWERMRAEIERIGQNQSAGVMALLQGVIEAKRVLYKPTFSFRSTPWTPPSEPWDQPRAYSGLGGGGTPYYPY